VRGGAFIAPRAVDPGPSRPTPAPQPIVAPASDGGREAQARSKGRVPSLIERVTGVGRRPAPAPAPAAPRPAAPGGPAAPPPARPAQQRLAPLDPEQRPPQSKEEDLLDIPAFLRRQAN
jgi:cell division protein FtsZ